MKQITRFAIPLFGIVFLLSSCGKVDGGQKVPTVSENFYLNLHVGTDVKIQGENLAGLQWTASNSYTASARSDMITPKHVGFTRLRHEDPPLSLTCQVTPLYQDYDLPIVYEPITSHIIVGDKDIYITEEHTMIWGDAPSSVYLREHSINPSRVRAPKSSKTLQIFNTGNPKSPLVVYYFTNEKLTSSATVIDLSYIDNIPKFLAERYVVDYVDLNKCAAYFSHKKGTEAGEIIDYIGGMQYSSDLGGLLLLFMPYSNSKSDVQYEERIKEVAHQIEFSLIESLMQ